MSQERRRLVTVLLSVGISMFVVRGVLRITDAKGWLAFLGMSALLFFVLDADEE